MTLLGPTRPGAGAPRFRPVSTRRRLKNVATALAVFLFIGVSAWAFGVNAAGGFTKKCVDVVPDASAVVPDKVAVNVYNSTPETGLADRVANDLKTRGFRIGLVGNDPLIRKIRGTGELRAGPAGERQVAALQAWQPGMTVIMDSKRRGPSVDFVVGSKFGKLNDTPTIAGAGQVCS